MNKMMIIGSPGSGKSTLSKIVGKKLGYKVLHLDYIYHIDNFKHITRDELKIMIESFVSENDNFIIDGNYGGTMEWRLQFCDTVVLLDIDTEICLKNVISRSMQENREDMAPGFDNSVIDKDFLEYVKNFKKDKIPGIKELINSKDINKIILNDDHEVEEFINSL